MDLNKNWKFSMDESIVSGHLINFDDSAMRTVDVPHDYSIEQPLDAENSDGCVGYARGGVAWYRKYIDVSKDMLDKKLFVCFDGIYNRAHIYFNEQLITFHPYGYSPCLVDLTEYMVEGKNVLAVHVDHSRICDSRWYTGSGIYRKVALYVLPKTYIPVWGTRVTTDIIDSVATVTLSIDVVNDTGCEKAIKVKTDIYAPNGDKVCELVDDITVDKSQTVTQTCKIENPVLWGIYQGNRYKAVTRAVDGDTVIQTKETVFGIREFRFDVNEGFFLNGKNELIKGVCIHHDAGLVGAAIPNDVMRRRIEVLIEAGTNAIRTAHNPYSSDFFDLCDEMGILVQEEFYDEWDFPKGKKNNCKEELFDYKFHGHDEFFAEYAKEDLQNVIRRDFNHPCIIQWSIGNEIEWTYPKYNIATGYFGADASGGYFWTEPPYSVEEIRRRVSELPKEHIEVGKTAKLLSQWTKEMDTTRPVIANCILPSASYESGYTDALDMVGFSYRRVVYDRCHENYPDKPIMGTENLGQWHEWKAVLDRPFISGMFIWVGIDYIGECGGRRQWPTRVTPSGFIDAAGFDKPSFHMMKALWRDEPELFIASQTVEKSVYNVVDGALETKENMRWDRRMWIWHDMNMHWNYDANTDTVVEIYSNCESVALYLNGELVSEQKEEDNEDRIYKWLVPYAQGEVMAVGMKDGREVRQVLRTAKPASRVEIVADKTSILADFDSVVHITAQLFDEDGNPVKFREEEIEFCYKGDVKFWGVDNGHNDFAGEYQNPKILTNRGRALMIAGANNAGEIEICAKLGGVVSNTIKVVAK